VSQILHSMGQARNYSYPSFKQTGGDAHKLLWTISRPFTLRYHRPKVFWKLKFLTGRCPSYCQTVVLKCWRHHFMMFW